MANGVTIKITGLQELGERLRGLADDTAKRAVTGACKAGAVVVQKKAIINAPQYPKEHKLEGVTIEPGNLKRNIVSKKVSRSAYTAEYIVTVRGKRKDGFAARYGRLVEFGTVKMNAESFLRTAFESEKLNAVEAMRKVLEKRIIKGEKNG